MKQLKKYKYTCIKCGNKNFEQDEFRATGGPLAKIFDVQNKKFLTLSCSYCGYTEMYRKKTSGAGNVLDFFTN